MRLNEASYSTFKRRIITDIKRGREDISGIFIPESFESFGPSGAISSWSPGILFDKHTATIKVGDTVRVIAGSTEKGKGQGKSQ